MPDSFQKSTRVGSSECQHSRQLSADVLTRCAKLLASGEMDWPSGLPEEQQAELLAKVRSIRRSRLVKLIASQIAAEISREEAPNP